MTTQKDACYVGASLFGGSSCKADECQLEVTPKNVLTIGKSDDAWVFEEEESW